MDTFGNIVNIRGLIKVGMNVFVDRTHTNFVIKENFNACIGIV